MGDEAAADPVAQRARGREAEVHWDQGSDYSYVLRHSETGAILGMFGLHRQVGPTALEIGYWLHPDYLGHGYATRSVGVLTEIALSLRDVDRIEIHTDEANKGECCDSPATRLSARSDRAEDLARVRRDRTEADLGHAVSLRS